MKALAEIVVFVEYFEDEVVFVGWLVDFYDVDTLVAFDVGIGCLADFALIVFPQNGGASLVHLHSHLVGHPPSKTVHVHPLHTPFANARRYHGVLQARLIIQTYPALSYLHFIIYIFILLLLFLLYILFLFLLLFLFLFIHFFLFLNLLLRFQTSIIHVYFHHS